MGHGRRDWFGLGLPEAGRAPANHQGPHPGGLPGRVQEFELLAEVGNEWKRVGAGTTLGADFTCAISPVKASAIKLNILKATDGPTIKEIELLR